MTDVQARKLTAPSAVCIYGAAPLQPDGAAAACVRLDSSRCASTAQKSGAKSAHPPTPYETFRIKPLGKRLFLFVFVCLFVTVLLQLQNGLLRSYFFGFTVNLYRPEALNWCITIVIGATMWWPARHSCHIVRIPIEILVDLAFPCLWRCSPGIKLEF